MVGVAAGIAAWLSEHDGFPIILLVLNSVMTVPEALRAATLTMSKALLLFAVIATAMRSDLARILKLGWRAATPVVFATLTSFAAALAAVSLGAA